MMSARNLRTLLYANQSSVAGGLHEKFGRWSSLEKNVKKYHNHSFRRNAVPKLIHPQSRRNSSLSNPSPSIPASDIEPTNTPIDSPSKTLPEPSQLSCEVRQVMRSLPHAVVVITSLILGPEPSREPTGIVGMTLSSFTTITLSPDPIIMFNIKRPSRTLDALKSIQLPDTIAEVPAKEPRPFQIHILQANAVGSNIAKRFSLGGPISVDDLALLSTHKGLIEADIPYWPYDLSGKLASGVRRVFECELLQGEKRAFIDVGDHTLVFGKVKRVIKKNKLVLATEKPWKALCYLQGEYHSPLPIVLGHSNKLPNIEPRGKSATENDTSVQENEVKDEEKVLEVEEKVLEVEEKVLEVEEKVLEVEEKVLEVEEKVLEVEEKVLEVEEKVLEVEDKNEGSEVKEDVEL